MTPVSTEREWVNALDKGLSRGYTSPEGKSFRYKLPKDGLRALETHRDWSPGAIDEVARISGPVVAFDPDGFWLLADGRAWPKGLFAAILRYTAEYLRGEASVELPPEPAYWGASPAGRREARSVWERRRKEVVDYFRAQAPHPRDYEETDPSDFHSDSAAHAARMAAYLAGLGPCPEALPRSSSEETEYLRWKDKRDRKEAAVAALKAWGKDLPPPPAPWVPRGGSW